MLVVDKSKLLYSKLLGSSNVKVLVLRLLTVQLGVNLKRTSLLLAVMKALLVVLGHWLALFGVSGSLRGVALYKALPL